MIGGKQGQSVGDGSMAVQTTGDVTINHGVSPEQMLEIFSAVSKQIETFTSASKTLIESRLGEFKESILEKFEKDPKANPEAFADPDFQHTLFAAQKAYARSGDKELHDTLLGLVVERSKQGTRTRLSLSLNDAIEKAGLLTSEEFSALSFAFYFKNIQQTDIQNPKQLSDIIVQTLLAVSKNVPTEPMAYSYLESIGCAKTGVGGFRLNPAFEILKDRYPYTLTLGGTREELEALFPDPIIPRSINLIGQAPLDNSRFQFKVSNTAMLKTLLASFGIPVDIAQKHEDICRANPASAESFLSNIPARRKDVEFIFDRYDNSQVREITLTSAGVALGHTNLTALGLINADLSIWIK